MKIKLIKFILLAILSVLVIGTSVTIIITGTNNNSVSDDAKYLVEHYLENIEDDDYTLAESEEKFGVRNKETSATAKTYEGFTAKEITQSTVKGDGSTVVKVYYTRNLYIFSTYKTNDKAGNISGADLGLYKYGKQLSVTAETNEGYTFSGWYDGDNLLSSDETYTFDMPNKNLQYKALYVANKYTITVDNALSSDGATYGGIVSGNEYDFDSEITVSVVGIADWHRAKWTRNDNVSYIGKTYTFKVPAQNLTITLEEVLYSYDSSDSKFIYFGVYPQTKVSDESLSSLLTAKAGDLPTESASKKWTDYGYYIENNIESYMWYQDILYKNENYRGVYFTTYRPYNIYTNAAGNWQQRNGYYTSTVYWFKFEPIRWKVLENKDGKALLIADLLLDSQDYEVKNTYSTYSHTYADGEGYANNYALSHIRAWLNDNFYNTAFTEDEQNIILTTEVDNSGNSTGDTSNPYASENTNDKIFLLSYSEARAYYRNYWSGDWDSKAAQAKGTDYAKSQGLGVESNGNSPWSLRSPTNNSAIDQIYINDEGYVREWMVYVTGRGVRPLCWINL